jgi:hypothetical protein
VVAVRLSACFAVMLVPPPMAGVLGDSVRSIDREVVGAPGVVVGVSAAGAAGAGAAAAGVAGAADGAAGAAGAGGAGAGAGVCAGAPVGAAVGAGVGVCAGAAVGAAAAAGTGAAIAIVAAGADSREVNTTTKPKVRLIKSFLALALR